MYVCICHGVTEKDIQKAAKEGANSIEALRAKTGATSGCGTCIDSAIEVLQAQHHKKTPDFLNVLQPNMDWQVPA